MIPAAAASSWEEWDGDNSQIHNTMISVGLWFVRGARRHPLRREGPGLPAFHRRPGVESGLKAGLDASLMTGYGKITHAWHMEGNALTLGPCRAGQHDRHGRHTRDRP